MQNNGKEAEWEKIASHQIFRGKYTLVCKLGPSGTRDVYLTEFQLPGNHGIQLRVVKVDKTSTQGNGQVSLKKGLNTINEIGISNNLRGARQFTQFLDTDTLPDGRGISIEEYFASQSLEERLEKGPLKKTEFEEIFSQIIEAEQVLKEENILHRDLKPSNILIGTSKEKPSLEVKLTDLANARQGISIQEGATVVYPTQLTLCGHQVLHPGLIFGSKKQYDEEAELYSLGMNILMSLTGKPVIQYDAENKTGTRIDTGESILQNNTTSRLHEEAIFDALKNTPKWSRKYHHIIKDLLTISKKRKYKGIEQVTQEWEETKAGFYKYLKTSKLGKLTTAALLATTLLATYAITKPPEKPLNEPYIVTAQWDTSDMTIDNNLVKLNLWVSSRTRQRYEQDSSTVLYTEPEEKINVFGMLQNLPRPGKKHLNMLGEVVDGTRITPTLSGQIYFEGFKPKEFSLPAAPVNRTHLEEWPGYWGDIPTITTPKTPGTYNLIVEMYAPRRTVEGYPDKEEDFLFPEPGTTLVRERIPIQVGEETGTFFGKAYVGFNNRVFFYSTKKNDYNTYSSLKDEEIFTLGQFTNGTLKILPREYSEVRFETNRECKDETIHLFATNNDKLIHTSSIPISCRLLGGTSKYENPALPTREFPYKAMEIRKQILRLLKQ